MDLAETRIHPDYIVASLLLLMIVVNICYGWEGMAFLITDFNFFTLESYMDILLGAIGAAILLLTKHGSVAKTVSVSSFIFGAITLDSAVNYLILYGQEVDYDVISFATESLALILGLILIGNIIIYWTRASQNLYAIFFSMAGILCLEIIDDITRFRYGADPADILESLVPNLPMYVLAVYTILLLRSKSVRVITMLYNIRESSERIRESAVPIGVVMDRAEILNLMRIAETGMDTGSYVVNLNSFYPVDYRIVLTRNGGSVSVLFCSSDDETGVGMARFVMKGVWTDTGDAETCDVVRIYGNDGFYIQMIAGGPFRSSAEKRSLAERIRG